MMSNNYKETALLYLKKYEEKDLEREKKEATNKQPFFIVFFSHVCIEK